MAVDADYFLQLSAPHFVTIRGLIRHILQDEADVEDAPGDGLEDELMPTLFSTAR